MNTNAVNTAKNVTTKLSKEVITDFAATLRGELVTPESANYDEVRSIWNSMIDRHPRLIVRCAGASDVMQAVRFARSKNLAIAVRGRGHNIAGNAVCNDGLMIDLEPMTAIRIDPKNKTARVEPGCTLADFDHEAQAFGLATPLGVNSTTGVSGLTLGGGFGWLSRKYGMTVDNLLSVDMVTAEGKLVHASKDENPDLFWANQGGGGNFGVVTSFEFKLHEVGPEILSGFIVHPFEDAKKVLEFYRDFAANLPDETSVWVVLRKAPPMPFLPTEWHGKEVVVLAAFHAGKMSEGEKVLKPLREFGNPIADVVGPHLYTQWQQVFDPLLTPGARNYWKSHNFTSLSDALFDLLISYTANLPSEQTEIFIGQIGGQMERVDKTATAYPHRDARYVMNVHTRWEDEADDKRCVQWARDFFKATASQATGGVYVNFLTEDESDRIRAAYGPNYDRLMKVKSKYDPSNLFHFNQNLKPSPAS